MLRGNSILIAAAILFFGGWQPIWNAPPTSVLTLASQNTFFDGGYLQQGADYDFSSTVMAQDDAKAESTIGNYFIAGGGLAILVNDHYYGAEITNRFFNSTALSWIALFLALSACGLTFFIIL